MSDTTESWKLELRYGRRSTPFSHFTAVADGVAGEIEGGFDCPPGPAVMTMKTWAHDAGESADMIRSIGAHLGFTAQGDVEIYETEPEQPPGEHPSGYDIRFVPYDPD